MSLKIYIDGAFVAQNEAKISVFDHGFLYGDGVFEGIRAYNGRVLKLHEHIDRLYDSAKAIMLDIGVSKDEMVKIVLESLRVNNLKDSYIRLVISRGMGDLGLDPRKCPKPSIICIAAHIAVYPPELYERGLEIVTATVRRNIPEALNPRIKSLNYLNNILAKIEANRQGAPEAIMLNQDGFVAECTADNIFIIKNGRITTPPAYMGALGGITKDTVVEIAKTLGKTVEENVFTRYEVYTADEMFLTGTGAEVIPVTSVDGRSIGNGEVGSLTKELIKAYKDYANKNGVAI